MSIDKIYLLVQLVSSEIMFMIGYLILKIGALNVELFQSYFKIKGQK